MSEENKLIENPETVKQNFEYEERMKKIREEVLKKFEEYRNTLNQMAADAPIGVLCLPKVIENALIAHGCHRVYHLFDCDFAKVKGLGVRRIGDLTASLDKFIAML
jgi:hypothetical protein